MLLGFFVVYSTSELSIPLAYCHISIPNFPNFFIRYSSLVWASVYMVVIFCSFSFWEVFFPIINKSSTGSGHIFIGISFVKRVCTLSGFWKSEAILAHNLLFPIPTLTVKPYIFFMSSLILWAIFIGGPNCFWLAV